jgi:hypothetical protein
VSKKVAAKLSYFVLLLALLAVPASKMHAQSSVVTGSEPEPPGEPDGDAMEAMAAAALIAALLA